MSAKSTAPLALRERQESAIRVLTDSFANDLIDLETFDRRATSALRAVTAAELDQLTADLAPLPPGLMAMASSSTERALQKVTAVFSSIERRGPWSVPSRVKTRAVFGNVELDFRHATFAPGVTDLAVRAVFGNVEIIVPPDVGVECEGTAIFAAFEHGAAATPDPHRPLLRIRGAAVFGNVEISVRRAGESARTGRRSIPLLGPHGEAESGAK
jgi:hypothetical protein